MPEAACGFNDVPGGASGRDLLVSLGPTLLVNIGFDPGYRRLTGGPAPLPGLTQLEALIDTGATECCIDSLIAAQLKLPIVDRRQIGGVSGAQVVNMHLAQVFVPSLQFTILGQFAGVHLQAGGQMHKALLGRTFLKVCSMSYDGPSGKVQVSRT